MFWWFSCVRLLCIWYFKSSLLLKNAYKTKEHRILKKCISYINSCFIQYRAKVIGDIKVAIKARLEQNYLCSVIFSSIWMFFKMCHISRRIRQPLTCLYQFGSLRAIFLYHCVLPTSTKSFHLCVQSLQFLIKILFLPNCNFTGRVSGFWKYNETKTQFCF